MKGSDSSALAWWVTLAVIAVLMGSSGPPGGRICIEPETAWVGAPTHAV
jgi:hypothetical protein